jgi:4-alpha-glucanotransferase
MRVVLDFCGRRGIEVPCGFTPEVHAAFIEGLFACESWLAVHMITDIFGLSDRFNVPGAIGDQNWTTRIEGAIKEWDQLYKNQVLLSVEALQKTARVPAA